MANHKSALKRNRQNQQRRLVNQMNRSRLRTQLKKFRAAMSAGKLDEAREILPRTLSIIDKSVQKGVIKANAAQRYKSRISRNLHAAASAA